MFTKPVIRDPEKFLENIEKFQSNIRMKPYQCPDCTTKLVGAEIDGTIALTCKTCNHVRAFTAKEIEIINFFAN